ncbi:MAG: SAM-dependent methyltransferase [Nitrososphaerales archaeon]
MSGFIWGAGFQPTPKKDIELAAKLLKLQEGMTVYDLGSGTGSVVILLAKKYKVRCVGIEVDPLKSTISRLRIARHKDLKNLIEIQRKNFFKADFTKADCVYLFLSGGTLVMEKLARKLVSELKSGTKIVSYIHVFKGVEPEIEEGHVKIYSIESLRSRF